MRFRNPVFLSIVFLLSLFVVRGASAHGRTPRLEISMERINPGGVLDIRGVEFDYEELVTLFMERQGVVVSLGEIQADLEGIFIRTIVLPSDLPAGEYTIRGVTEHHDVLSPIITVHGPAISNEGGGQGERDDADGLLAPMPTYAPGVVPGGVSQPSVSPIPEQDPVPSRTPRIIIVLIMGAITILAIYRFRVAAKS